MKRIKHTYGYFHKSEHSFMIVMAIIIGTFAGFASLLIRISIKAISDFAFPGSGTILENISAAPWYMKIIIPALGGLIVGPLTFFFAKEAKGHGVPEVMQSILTKGGIIRPRVAMIKAVTSAITIGTGGSVGREGPIIQIGSSIGSSIGQIFKVSNERMKTLVGCGAAAGIAAAFNAPVAGALFAVEIILQSFSFRLFSPIVISSVMATVISHQFEGNYAAFIVPKYQLKSYYELIFYFALAGIAAIVAVLFIKVLYFFEDFWDEELKIPAYIKPIIGGILLGLIGIKLPQIMGVGYDSINSALHNGVIWKTALVLIFVKILATSITLGSGGSGGVFAPSLFIGAMTGIVFGVFVNKLFPDMTSSPGAYALVAMGGLVAATTHAPITAIIMIFELTTDYNIILPLMITCIISTLISTKITRESIYTLKLVRRKIHLKFGKEINIMKSIYVKDIYSPDFLTISENSKFNKVIDTLVKSKDPYVPVVDRNSRLYGVVSVFGLKEHIFNRENMSDLLIAKDVAHTRIATVKLDDNCQTVMSHMTNYSVEGLPVIDSDGKILGMIWRKDILDTYNKEIEKRDTAASFASKISMSNEGNTIHFLEGYSMTELPIPEKFIGKSIKTLDIRNSYKVNILFIRNSINNKPKIPSPNYIFKKTDTIIITGEVGEIDKFKSL